jgi:putative transposase
MPRRKNAPPQRKINWRLYVNATEEKILEWTLSLCCRVHNTLLEMNLALEKQGLPFMSKDDMEDEIVAWKKTDKDHCLKTVYSHSLQVVAARVDQALTKYAGRKYDYELRLAQAEEEAGRPLTKPEIRKLGKKPEFPRFKSIGRFSGWGYKQYKKGWELFPGERVCGDVELTLWDEEAGKKRKFLISMRGKGRFTGMPRTAEVKKKHGKWYLSVTYDVAPEALYRKHGDKEMSFDWGVKTLATIVETGRVGTIKIGNPKWLKKKLARVQKLNKAISQEERVAMIANGLDPDKRIPRGFQFEPTKLLKRLRQDLANLHAKIARQRLDFYHKLVRQWNRKYGTIGTEEINTAGLIYKHGSTKKTDEKLSNSAKRNINRSLHDAAPSTLLGILSVNAVESGLNVKFADTKELRATRRCHKCGKETPKKVTDRTHCCRHCGCVCDRDDNAAWTIWRWMHEGNYWEIPRTNGLGRTGSSVYRGAANAASITQSKSSAVGQRETPPIAAKAV